MDCSLPGSSVHGIFQARVLEWGAIAFSNLYDSYLKVKVTQSCLTLCDPMDCSPPGSSVHEDSPGKNTGVGCHALLQGIFPTQGSNPGLPHCRRILYQLSHQGSLLTEWGCFILPSVTSDRQVLSWSISQWGWRWHLCSISHQDLASALNFSFVFPLGIGLQAPPR